MALERPKGHDLILSGLWEAARAERLPHALLFTGVDGIGKYMAAKWFLAGLFCEEGPAEPCGACGACKRFAAGNLGDFLEIEPEFEKKTRKRIRLHRVAAREGEDGPCLEGFLSFRPSEGGWRGVVLRDVELATREAENALLKTLEEPGDACCLILVTAHPGHLLETVRSRCVQVGFDSPDLELCAAVLGDAGFDEEVSRRVARWVSCAPGRALGWAQRGVVEERALLVSALLGDVDALDVTPRLLELEGDLGEGTPGALARKRAVGVVELGVDMMRDLARIAEGVPTVETAHGDLPAELTQRPSLSSQARRGLETLWRARRELDSNLAPEAVLDRALSLLQAAFEASPAAP